MILEYTITDKMISSVVSISEKIGQIREIRNTHRHIDFDMMCSMKNAQDTLRDIGVQYPDSIISELITSKSPVKGAYDDDHYRKMKQVVDKHRRVRDCKSFHPSNFVELAYRTKNNTDQPQIPKDVIKGLKDPDKFFLYRVAEFCDACNTITDQIDLIQLWLTTLFLEEYSMLLYFPYGNILIVESFVLKNGKRVVDKLEYEASIKNSRYPLVEFYLSLIDSALDACIRVHYKLANPKSDRVEMLKGMIQEPFSRKDYMKYYKISTATASLDLRKATEKGILIIQGDKRNARYWYRK